MKIDFRIPVFKVQGEQLIKVEDRIFEITFLFGQSWKNFRICVDGVLSNQVVSVLNYNGSKKKKYLSAIQYVLYSEKILDKPKTSKMLTLEKVKQVYAKGIAKSINVNLLETQTEQSRDVLQQYNLVFIQ